MIKKLKYLLLIIFPIILTISLIFNIHKYTNNKNLNKDIIEKNNNYQIKIKENNLKSNELTNQINKLKEDNKDKIWEYNRWIKWNQEINSKIN